jgi:hypothetical protein
MSVKERHSSISFSEGEDALEVDVFPDDSGQDIKLISGKYGNTKITLSPEELAGLPMIIKGANGSLSERIKYKISGHVNANNEVEIFVTQLATTLVQFKLMGRIFPQTKDLRLTCENINYATLHKLSKRAENDPKMKAWLSPLIKFYNQWKFALAPDSTLDLMEGRLDDLETEISMLKRENLTLKEDVEHLREEVRRLFRSEKYAGK